MTQTTLRADLRLMPRAFWVLVFGMFVNRFGSFVYPFLTLFLAGRHFSAIAISAVVAGYGIGAMLAQVAGGWFADRFGRRLTIVAGTLANAAAVFALYFAHSTPALATLTVLAGLSSGFYHPAAMALVADLVPAAQRLPAYSLLRLAANAGFAFGTSAGGFLMVHSTFWLFAGDGLTTAIFGLIALLALPGGLKTSVHEASWSVALAHLRKDTHFLVLFASQFLVAMILGQSLSSYAIFVGNQHLHIGALAPSQIFGLLVGWNGVMIVCFELLLTRVTRHYDPNHVMALGSILAGAGLALNAVLPGLSGLFVAITVFSIGEMLAIPVVNSQVSHLAPHNMRGRYMGALGCSWSMANIIAPGLGLQLLGYSPTLLWLSCAVVGLAGAAVVTLGHRESPERA